MADASPVNSPIPCIRITSVKLLAAGLETAPAAQSVDIKSPAVESYFHR